MSEGMGKSIARFFDGVQLAEHLYPDHKGRAGYWRYKRPNRSIKTFLAKTVHEANEIAEDANRRRHLTHLDRTTTAYAVEQYILHAERLKPSLKDKESWRNRCYAMRNFAQAFPARTVTEREIWEWFDGLTHSQQILREAEFRRMWTFFLRESYVGIDSNPFDRDRLLRREKPVSDRERLTLPAFWKIYAKASAGLQVAMGISLLTTMRRGDVVTLTRANLQDGYLRKIISKSEEKRGLIKAAKLQWKLSSHPELEQLVQRAIASAPKTCEFIVHDSPKSYRLGRYKKHSHQVLPDRLSRLFTRARIAAGVGGANPPTFHEVRSLGSFLLAQQGEQLTDVMDLMGHSDEEITKLYLSGHPLPWQTVDVRVRDAGGTW